MIARGFLDPDGVCVPYTPTVAYNLLPRKFLRQRQGKNRVICKKIKSIFVGRKAGGIRKDKHLFDFRELSLSFPAIPHQKTEKKDQGKNTTNHQEKSDFPVFAHFNKGVILTISIMGFIFNIELI